MISNANKNTIILEDRVVLLSEEEAKSVVNSLPNHRVYNIGNLVIMPNYASGYNTDESLSISETDKGCIYIGEVGDTSNCISLSKDVLSEVIDALTEIEYFLEKEDGRE